MHASFLVTLLHLTLLLHIQLLFGDDILCCLAHHLCQQTYQAQPSFTKSSKFQHILWQIQKFLIAFIVRGTVYMANATGVEWWGFLALSFILNFGVEPMDMSKLP
jgi:hypothetical protein